MGGISNWAPTAAGIINARLAIPSDFTIEIEFEETDGDYHAVVTVENVGGNTSSNLVLQFVITESKLPIQWGGMDEQNGTNRLMVPNQNGTALDFSGGNTQVIELDFNTSFWDVDNCTMVAFVQDNGTKEILQGTKMFMANALYNIDAEAKALKHPIGEYCGNTVEPVVTIKNMGSDPLTSLDIEYSINGGTAQSYAWTGELEFNIQEDVTLPEISFTSQSENIFEFTVSNPNGQSDPNPENDSFEGVFDAAYAAPTSTVLMELKTDNYPEETTWEVTNSAGDVIYSGGPYNGQQGTIFNETFEFEDDDCYTFAIYDAYGDGICCAYGQGYYKLMDEESVVFMEGGEFGSEELTPFSIGGPPPPPPTGDCEGFDDLTVGGYAAEQLGGNWTTWSGTPGTSEDAVVSDLYSVSPSNSILVEGSTDLVHLITGNNITSGKWSYSLNIYVPAGTAGYYNLQKDVVPGTEWGFQVMFEDDGTIVVDGGEAAALVQPFAYDTWINHEVVVDLDNDWCQLYIDGVLSHEYQWTLGTFGTAGANTLAGSNIYANAGTGGAPAGAHFDDMCIEQLFENENCHYLDELTVGGYVAEQLGDPWTTWSGEPGGAEDAMVSDMHSHSGGNSFAVDTSTIDLVLKLADEPITEGQWAYANYIYVPSGYSGYFNVQSDPTPGEEWVVELFFNDDGTGTVTQNSIDVDFTYSPDTWILVEIAFDLDMGLGEVWFDGEWFYQWEVATSIGGIDYYGWDVGGTPGAYYDDICFGEGWEIVPTGLGQEISKVESIVVYPNPARDIVNISVENNLKKVMVFDYMGSLVIEERANGNESSINTSQLKAGVYIFRVLTDEGFTTKQVIIK